MDLYLIIKQIYPSSHKQKSPREEAILTFEIFLVVISIGFFNDEFNPKHSTYSK